MLAVPLLFAVSIVSFVLVSVTPGDAAREILGVNASATPGAYERLRQALGLNLPLYAQYWHWLRHAIVGDLGASLFSGQSVAQVITQRLPVTLSLMIGAVLVAALAGVALGIASSVGGRRVGHAVNVVAIGGFAFPAFWVGAELIAIFAVKLRWFPATGFVPLSQSPELWFRSLVLPVVALAFPGIAVTAKQTRDAMLEALASDYVRVARANGVRGSSLVLRHALKNAALPIVTVLGIQAISMMGGAVLIENVFALPGLGSLIVSASIQHDLPLVQGVAVVFTVLVVVINVLCDLACAWLDPTVRMR